MCDLQEKFRPAIHEFDKVYGSHVFPPPMQRLIFSSVTTAQKLIRFAKALSLPIHTTTQNATRLGPIVTELGAPEPHVDKTSFSMYVPAVASALEPNSSVAIVGIESHICITQTAVDLIAAGHKVYVVADGVSSCNPEEIPVALARLRSEGAVVTSSESWMYEVMGDAGIPEFKDVIKIVKDTGADTKAALGALMPKM